ncbi:GH32 C-terminal domain-containing protein [Paenibacillus vietnamensis]|uniref:GH32 C-terminal domain-containing protein n=1 Tax=Paenibacillus vietnamensis TaxID=2590547 RepID=UPI002964603A|nr:GH32 C-terminal domain-containing protein [Paenibacillus vietnamensis]
MSTIRIYIANDGDTLKTITKKLDVDLAELISLNPDIMSPDLNIAGKAINLPSSTRPVTEQNNIPTCPPFQPSYPLYHWIPLTSLEEMKQADYDVIIVGTGGGGGSVLRRLCENWKNNNKRIGVIERGDLLLPTHARNLATMDSERLNNLFGTISEPIGKCLPMFPGARILNALGGKTLFWGLVTPRMPISDLLEWPVDIREMEFYYRTAEQAMDVTHEYSKGSAIQSILLQRLQNSGYYDAIQFPIAVDLKPTTNGEIHSNVNWSSINFLAYALYRKKYDLAVNAKAVQILVENGKTAGVKVMSREKKPYFLKAKSVVLSAGTFETTRILLNSGIQGSAIGHYLVDHSYLTAVGKINRRELPEDLGTLGIIVPQTNYRSYQIQIGGPFGNQGDYFWHQPYREKPLLEEELKVGFTGYGKVESRFDNMMFLDPVRKDEYGLPEIQVNYSYSEKDRDIINQMFTAIEQVSEIMQTPIDRIDGRPDICQRPPGSDYHAAGTCRMGDNPSTSSTNRYGQIHNVPGLYVADNSILPTIGGVNPTLSTVALAIRTADYIAKECEAGIPVTSARQTQPVFNEPYRPQFHFTPIRNWMNDPNGLVYFKGEYHLFYQYNPFGNEWGNMSWGHAISKDLVHWKHLPVALEPDHLGMIFSGSAVVDERNTSGFFTDKSGGLVAIYTSSGETQQQSIAYSTDNGRTWTKYAGNPVIPNPGIKDFRDPKVFWHNQTQRWIMVLSAGDKVMFYASPNLKTWTYLSEFGAKDGDHSGVWEVPELFELPVDGNPTHTKWVLKVDINPGEKNLGSRGQYFIGRFDGTNFINEHSPDKVLWVDYGKDFYASLSWENLPERRVWIAWMSNWQYANKTPTSPWRGAMSIPREVALKTIPQEGIRLVQAPVRELQLLRTNFKKLSEPEMISPGSNLLTGLQEDTYEIIAEFELDSATEFGFKVRKGDREETIVGYDAINSQMFVNRTNSGNTQFSPLFPGEYRAPLSIVRNRIKLHIFVDRSSVEVFGNGGERVITSLIFPSQESRGVELYAKNGNVNLIVLNIFHVKSVWRDN